VWGEENKLLTAHRCQAIRCAGVDVSVCGRREYKLLTTNDAKPSDVRVWMCLCVGGGNISCSQPTGFKPPKVRVCINGEEGEANHDYLYQAV